MRWLTWGRAAIGVVAIALLGLALTELVAGHPIGVALLLIDVVLVLLLIVIAMTVEVFQSQRRTQLGTLLGQGIALVNQDVPDDDAYAQWGRDYQRWFQTTHRYIRTDVSSADAALFTDTTGGMSYSFSRSRGAEHQRALNTLTKHIANLRSILERQGARSN
jgi:hypothetical protein